MPTIKIKNGGFHRIISPLEDAGFTSRLVGGAVRDMLLGRDPKDLDIVTTAPISEVQRTAHAAGISTHLLGTSSPTIACVVEGETFEVTQTQTGVATTPCNGDEAFRVDAGMRDLTINAMSVDSRGVVHDYHGGQDDLLHGRLRFVGDARDRILEDPLRIIRYFRFCAKYGDGRSHDAAALDAIRQLSDGLHAVSVERVWREVARILEAPDPELQIDAMHGLGVADVIGLPWFSGAKEMVRTALAERARPATVIGMLCGSEETADHLSKQWKLSNSERADAVTAGRVMASFEASSRHWLAKASTGVSPDRLIPVLAATGRQCAADALKGEIPQFPLLGRDLVAAGFEPGPTMRDLLIEARRDWEDSGFGLSAEDLVANLVNKTRAAMRL